MNICKRLLSVKCIRLKLNVFLLLLRSEWVDSAFDFCHTLVAEDENEVRDVSSPTKTNDGLEHKENFKCSPVESTSIQVKAIPDIELSSNQDSFDGSNSGPTGMHSSMEAAKDDKIKTNNNIEYGNIEFYNIRFKFY